ncbi:MAG: gamma-glutamyl-gamma-aminobutyrate hydrolase family protein [Bacteriovoracaceae bacterium]|nr:gamma-glutamyl-gamma-aminobutyrate hydrolase family protein [Bacteriovoracaceae bacterium]
MIKIGLTACFMYPDPSRIVFGHKSLTYMENDMLRYIMRDGVLPILIPDLPFDQLTPILKELDGIVFQGGVDLSPESYGDDFLNKEKWPGDKYRDDYELKIADYAFKNDIPMLGICRGFQLLNAYFGGKLHQDLETEIQTPMEHRNAETYDTIHHSVELTTKGYLSNLYNNKSKIEVNTVHHQGVKDLGADLVEEARCPDDNLIEAFTYKNMDRKYVLGVQWHPEFSPTIKDKVDDPTPIYDDFLKAIEQRG